MYASAQRRRHIFHVHNGFVLCSKQIDFEYKIADIHGMDAKYTQQRITTTTTTTKKKKNEVAIGTNSILLEINTYSHSIRLGKFADTPPNRPHANAPERTSNKNPVQHRHTFHTIHGKPSKHRPDSGSYAVGNG